MDSEDRVESLEFRGEWNASSNLKGDNIIIHKSSNDHVDTGRDAQDETSVTSESPLRKQHISNSETMKPVGSALTSEDASKLNENTNLSVNNTTFQRRYNQIDKAPYIIHIQSKDNSTNPIHHLNICKIIFRSNSKDLIYTKKIGRGKLLLEFRTAFSANQFLDNRTLNFNNLIAFIPSYKTHRIGIIRDIPIEINLEDEIEYIETPSKIIEFNRFNKRISDNNETKYVPSRTIKVIFEGSILPKEIYLYKMRYIVYPFIPRTRICYTCFRIGHIGKNCRGKPRCLYCGLNKHLNSEECPKKNFSHSCINCGGNHLANSRLCPVFIERGKIQALATSHNISLFEAKEKFHKNCPQTYNGENTNFDYINFPLLNVYDQRPGPHSLTYNRFSPLVSMREEDELDVSPNTTYANIVKDNNNRKRHMHGHRNTRLAHKQTDNNVRLLPYSVDHQSNNRKSSPDGHLYSDNSNGLADHKYTYLYNNRGIKDTSLGLEPRGLHERNENFIQRYDPSGDEHIIVSNKKIPINSSHIKEFYDKLFKDFLAFTNRYYDSSMLRDVLDKTSDSFENT